MSQEIVSRVEAGVGHLVVNAPERRNAVSLAMWEAIERTLDAFAADDEVRAVVVSGAGDKAFVSGADISKFETERATPEQIARYDQVTDAVFAKLVAHPKPTLAAVTGSCVGGGVAIAVCCDLRFAGKGARFGIPAARLGLGYAYEGVRQVVDLVGPAYAKEMFFTAKLFSAAEAHEMGLVNRVLPDEQVEAYAADTARTIASNAPLTVASVKFTIGELLQDPAARKLAEVEAKIRACVESQDYVEGRRAFMEKRKPAFTGH